MLTIPADEWDRQSHPMKKNEYGVFEITVPAKDGKVPIRHGSKIKVGGWKLDVTGYAIATGIY